MVAAAKARWAKLSPNVRGAGFVVTGAFVLIVMASMVKHLGQSLPSFEVLFVRFFAGLIVIALMGIAMYELFSIVERRSTRWAHRGQHNA